MKERIALFLPSLSGGGVERVMLNLAHGFVERGLKVDLVLSKAEGPYLSKIPTGVRVVDLNVSRMLASLPGLVRYLRGERPRALLSAKNYVNVMSLCGSKLAGVPTRMVVSVHINPIMDLQNAQTFREKLMPFLMRIFYPRADAVVAVSKGVAEDLQLLIRLPKGKVQVIYNPVVTPELFSRAEVPLDHPWFAPGEPPVVIGVGRLTPQKDFPSLIRAFALVRKKRPTRLMILGEGKERPNLEYICRELGLESDVLLPGFMENPYNYMKRAGVFVLSSAWEGFGNVLPEAMALGTPVISTDCPSGPAEILENGRWGDLVPPGNVEALASAMLKRLEAPDKARVRGAAERAKDFSLDRCVDQYLALLVGGAKP